MLLPTLIAIPLLIIWLLALVDIIRRADLGIGSKVLWALLALVLPILGPIIYFFLRPSQPKDHPLPAAAVDSEAQLEPFRHGPA
jgi:Phospholipase_D-nuclease N-terminal